MSEYKIAVIRGDGIGVDVIEEGLKVLNEIAGRYEITLAFTEFPWGSDYYFEHGEMNAGRRARHAGGVRPNIPRRGGAS